MGYYFCMQIEHMEGNPAGEKGLSSAVFVVQAGSNCQCLEMQQRFTAGVRDLVVHILLLPEQPTAGAQGQP